MTTHSYASASAFILAVLLSSHTHMASALPTPQVTDLAALLTLTDDQLWNIFTQGDAVIPAQRKPGQYTTCAGETLINAFTTGDSNWPTGDFPGGYAGPLNNFFQRIWYGKIFNTDPTSNVTSLYNMILTNATMSYYAQVYTSEPGLSPDGKPSVILDYSASEIVPVRVFRDELRQVGPEMFLGRTWITDIIQSYGHVKTKFTTIPETISEEVANATYLYLVNALGLEGPGSNANYPLTARHMLPDNATEVPLGNPVPILYFALHCGNPTNKLSYTPLSLISQVANQLNGFTEPGAVLPPLNDVQEDGAVNNIAREAAFKSSVDLPPFQVPAFNPLDLGSLGTGLSVPNPTDFLKLSSPAELEQDEGTAPELAVPAKPMKAPYLLADLPDQAHELAPLVEEGLAELPQSFAPITLQYLMQWAAKVSQYALAKAFGLAQPSLKVGLQPTGASTGYTLKG